MKTRNVFIVMLLVLLAAFTLTACNPSPNNGPAEKPEEKPFVSKLPKRTGYSFVPSKIYKNTTRDGMDTYLFLRNSYDKWDNVRAYIIQYDGNPLTSLKAIVTDPEITKNIQSTGTTINYIAGNGQAGGKIFRIVGAYDMTIENDYIKEEENPKLLPVNQGWFDMVQDLDHEGKYIITDELYIEFDEPEKDKYDPTYKPNVPEGVWINDNFIEYKDRVMEGEKIASRFSSGKSVVNIPDITPLAIYGTWEKVEETDLPFKLPENFHNYY